MQLEDKFPLLNENYDPLECPHCGIMCYPTKKLKNETIVYNKHKCQGEYDIWEKNRYFKIDINGELIEPEPTT